jgi:hypothetical protein
MFLGLTWLILFKPAAAWVAVGWYCSKLGVFGIGTYIESIT